MKYVAPDYTNGGRRLTQAVGRRGRLKLISLSVCIVSDKLQYVDPFLFLANEFRKWTLESKLIISIGYGFGDEHINGILGQALKKSREKAPLCQAVFLC